MNKNNAMANVAMEAAYTRGGPWLDAVLEYIQGNVDLVAQRVGQMKHAELVVPEGTFLSWIDFRALELDDQDLTRFLRHEAGWGVTRGEAFGDQGRGFARVNLACRRAVLEQALDSLEQALAGFQGP